MDQNQFQYEQFYQAPPTEKNAKYYRACARGALKDKWVTVAVAAVLYSLLLVGVILIAMVPMMLIIMGASYAMEDPSMIGLGVLLIWAIIFLLMIFTAPPLTVGYYRIHLDLMDGKQVDFGMLFHYFKRAYGKSIAVYLLYTLIGVVSVILPLLVIVVIGAIISSAIGNPEWESAIMVTTLLIAYVASVAVALIQTYRYSMSFFILAEYPDMRPTDVMRNSRMVMKGRKWKLFCLQFSMIGWWLLMIPASILTCGIGALLGTYLLNAYSTTSIAAFYDDITNRAAAREVEFPSLDLGDYMSDLSDGNRENG